ncbi:hypothetical protein ES703_55698 [subsurface metagenome]
MTIQPGPPYDPHTQVGEIFDCTIYEDPIPGCDEVGFSLFAEAEDPIEETPYWIGEAHCCPGYQTVPHTQVGEIFSCWLYDDPIPGCDEVEFNLYAEVGDPIEETPYWGENAHCCPGFQTAFTPVLVPDPHDYMKIRFTSSYAGTFTVPNGWQVRLSVEDYGNGVHDMLLTLPGFSLENEESKEFWIDKDDNVYEKRPFIPILIPAPHDRMKIRFTSSYAGTFTIPTGWQIRLLVEDYGNGAHDMLLTFPGFSLENEESKEFWIDSDDNVHEQRETEFEERFLFLAHDFSSYFDKGLTQLGNSPYF